MAPLRQTDMSTATYSIHSTTPLAPSLPRLWGPCAIAFLLMLLTFSIPEDAPGGAMLDSIASKIKYGYRAMMIPVCGVLVLTGLRRGSSRTGVAALIPLFTFFGWAVLSVLWSPLPVMSLAQAANLLVLLLLCCVFTVNCRSAADTEYVLRFLCTSLLAVSLGLIVLKVLFPSLTIAERETVGLFHALNVSATASLGLILTVASFAYFNFRWAGRLLIPSFCIHGLMLYCGVSRLAVALTLVCLAILLVRHIPKLYAVGVIFAVSVSGVAYLALDPGLTLVRNSQNAVAGYAQRGQSSDELAELSGRDEMWGVMWDSWSESPWIGHGYFVSSATGEIEVWYDEGNFTAHNVWLQSLVSTGIVGFMLFAWGTLQAVLTAIWKNFRSVPHRPMVKLMLLLGFWFGCWSMMNDSLLGPIQPECVVFYVVLGMALGSVSDRSAVQEHRTDPQWGPAQS